MRKILALVLVGCLLVATGFANIFDKTSKVVAKTVIKHTDGGTKGNFGEDGVLIVDGECVTQAYYNLIYSSMFNQAYQYYIYYMGMGDDWLSQTVEDKEGVTIADDILNATNEYIAEEIVVLNLAKENGIVVDEAFKERIAAIRQQTIDGCGGQEAYKIVLEEIRTNDEAYTKSIERGLIYETCVSALTEEGGAAYVTLEEAEKLFSEKYLRVQHILISESESYDDEGNLIPARSKDEVNAIIDEIYAKLESGEEFDSLIDMYNEDPGLTSGEYYTFTDGQMVEEFEAASKKLKVGEYTKKAVRSDFGYHIIKRYEVEAEGAEFENYMATCSQEKLINIIRERYDNANIAINNEVLKPYIDEWNKKLQNPMDDSETMNG